MPLPSQSPPLWIEEDKRVFDTIIKEAEDDDGYFNFKQFTIPHLKKISHDIETNLMSDNTLFFFNLSISLLLWKDTINTEINGSVDLLALLFWNGVPGKLQKGYDNMCKKGLWQWQKVLYTLARGPPDVEALGFSLPSL